LKEEGAVDRVRKLNIVALKSSHMEQFIPRAFQLVFLAVFVALTYLILTTPPFPTVPPKTTVQQKVK
jgi:hypothetical protein